MVLASSARALRAVTARIAMPRTSSFLIIFSVVLAKPFRIRIVNFTLFMRLSISDLGKGWPSVAHARTVEGDKTKLGHRQGEEQMIPTCETRLAGKEKRPVPMRPVKNSRLLPGNLYFASQQTLNGEKPGSAALFGDKMPFYFLNARTYATSALMSASDKSSAGFITVLSSLSFTPSLIALNAASS